MSATPDAIAREWFEEVWNKGSEVTVDRLLAPDAHLHGLPTPDGGPIVGPAGFKPFFRQFRDAFPDIRVDVARTVTEGDYVTVHCHVTGTHRGMGLGIAPTRKPIDFWGMAIAHVSEGKVVEAWNSFDFLSLYQQIDGVQQLLATTAARPARPVG